jgi:hypothetical protein
MESVGVSGATNKRRQKNAESGRGKEKEGERKGVCPLPFWGGGETRVRAVPLGFGRMRRGAPGPVDDSGVHSCPLRPVACGNRKVVADFE